MTTKPSYFEHATPGNPHTVIRLECDMSFRARAVVGAIYEACAHPDDSQPFLEIALAYLRSMHARAVVDKKKANHALLREAQQREQAGARAKKGIDTWARGIEEANGLAEGRTGRVPFDEQFQRDLLLGSRRSSVGNVPEDFASGAISQATARSLRAENTALKEELATKRAEQESAQKAGLAEFKNLQRKMRILWGLPTVD